MGGAICRTCGGSGEHKPSMFDPYGIGNSGHQVEGYTRIPEDFNRELWEERRDEVEVEMNRAYDKAYKLQREYNQLEEEIEAYNEEQRALDE